MEREYYSIEEVAKSSGYSEADLIHFGALGNFQLCALFAGERAIAQMWDSDPDINEDATLEADGINEPKECVLYGPYPLTLRDMKKLEAGALEHIYSVIQNPLGEDRKFGAFLTCQLQPPALAKSTKIVVDKATLKKILEWRDALASSEHVVKEKPLAPKALNSVLIIIAALMKHSKLDWTVRGVAVNIKAMANDLNVNITEETIRNYLKDIDKAIQARISEALPATKK